MFALKKDQKRRRKGAPTEEILNYTLPKLHTRQNWYVDFKCFDPACGKMKRKKYMLDSIKKVSLRRERAAEIITNVTVRLRKGWNPWADVSDRRGYAQIQDVLDIYEGHIRKMLAAGSMKQKTHYDYSSRLGYLRDFIESRPIPIIYMYQFDQALISDFLDYIFEDCDSSARTRNNYRTWCSALCSWMVEKRYLESNPVEKIKSIPEAEKQRDALTPIDLRKMKEQLEKTDRHMLLACMMEYYTFIRPTELVHIRLQDIFLREQKVFVSSAVSKNKRDGMVGLNKES